MFVKVWKAMKVEQCMKVEREWEFNSDLKLESKQ